MSKDISDAVERLESCMDAGVFASPEITEATRTLLRYVRETEELLAAARNINGADWGVRRQMENSLLWYAWADKWEGGQIDNHPTALEAFNAIKQEK